MSVKVRLFDTLSREKKVLENLVVSAYFCGPTVYDVPHLGHARAYVVFDVLIRLLRYLGYRTIYVRNVTDIDDKIIKRAREEGVSPFEIADRYYRAFYDAMKELRVLAPNIEPRATAHIPEIIKLIETLIAKGYAYVAKDGVYFRVRRFRDYGKLSKRKLEDLASGVRIEPSPYKEDPLDFALWKFAKPGEPSWDSPWGAGRPGWHIECSAMVLKHLGETIDIHGGGEDLIFPHHENEIAQSEAATGKPFARIWFHVGLLRVGKEKMAKSLGNYISIVNALQKYDAETIRLFLIGVHYRKQLIFEWQKLDNAEKLLNQMYKAVFMAEFAQDSSNIASNINFMEEMLTLKRRFISELADDLNTTEAIRILREMTELLIENVGNVGISELKEASKLLRELGGILGILNYSLEELIQERVRRGKQISEFVPPNYVPSELKSIKKLVQLIIDVRKELRLRKIYDLADRIRDSLKELGITLEDIGDRTKFYIGDIKRLLG